MRLPCNIRREMPTKENPAKIVNRQIVEVPVDKLWDDENNRHNTRSDTIKLLLQRSIVKDKPDVLDPLPENWFRFRETNHLMSRILRLIRRH